MSFDELDTDPKDGVLTINEIKEGMTRIGVTLTDDEWALFLKAIDANSDGVLTFEEWRDILAP